MYRNLAAADSVRDLCLMMMMLDIGGGVQSKVQNGDKRKWRHSLNKYVVPFHGCFPYTYG